MLNTAQTLKYQGSRYSSYWTTDIVRVCTDNIRTFYFELLTLL